MHHIPRLVGRPLLAGMIAAVSLVACSSGEELGSQTEVAGVVLDSEDEGGSVEEPADEEAVSGETDPATEVPEVPEVPEDPDGESSGERPADLSLLRSGPTSVGTVWLSAAGQWVGLDGQSLAVGDEPSSAHLHAIVEVDAGRARFEGCELRLVAPDDAELQVTGEFNVEVVIAHASGDETRVPLDPFDVEVSIAPGNERDVEVEGGARIDLDVDLDRQVQCEGRFDRT